MPTFQEILEQVASLHPSPVQEERPVIVSNQERRTSDKVDYNDLELWKRVTEYLTNSNKLRENYAEKLYWLIVGEVVAIFLCVVAYGLRWIAFPEWMFALIISGVLAETFYTIHLITENLFPKKDTMEHFVSLIDKIKKKTN